MQSQQSENLYRKIILWLRSMKQIRKFTCRKLAFTIMQFRILYWEMVFLSTIGHTSSVLILNILAVSCRLLILFMLASELKNSVIMAIGLFFNTLEMATRGTENS